MRRILCAVIFVFIAVSTVIGFVGCEDRLPSDVQLSDLWDRLPEPAETEVSSEKIEICTNTVSDDRIAVPKGSEYFEDRQFEKAVKVFSDAGFANVTVETRDIEQSDDAEDGIVITVTVDGKADFSKGEKYDPDVPVVVVYGVLRESVESTPKATASESAFADSVSTEAGSPTETAYRISNIMVWIPTNGGTKYHYNAECSKMKNPTQVMLDEATEMGYTACKRCCK